MSFGKRVLAVSLRTANLLLCGVGGTMMGYGGFLAFRYPNADPFWAAVIALGAIHFLFSLSVLLCAWKSLFALRLYGTVLGLLAVAESSVTLLFWVRRRCLQGAG